MYYVHGEGIKSYFRTFKNAKKEKLSNFDYQNMFKSELENQQMFFIFWGEIFQALRLAPCKIKKMQCQNSKSLNTLGHFPYPGHSSKTETITVKGGLGGEQKLHFGTVCCYLQYGYNFAYQTNLLKMFIIMLLQLFYFFVFR